MAYSLGGIDAGTRDDLHIIRSVRNVFAHANTNVSFDTDEINNACLKLDPKRLLGLSGDVWKQVESEMTARQCFVLTTWLLAIKMLADAAGDVIDRLVMNINKADKKPSQAIRDLFDFRKHASKAVESLLAASKGSS
ncbi:MAG: hypothetical protein ACREHF_10195 [Rhizomicrobium sp.]